MFNHTDANRPINLINPVCNSMIVPEMETGTAFLLGVYTVGFIHHEKEILFMSSQKNLNLFHEC